MTALRLLIWPILNLESVISKNSDTNIAKLWTGQEQLVKIALPLLSNLCRHIKSIILPCRPLGGSKVKTPFELPFGGCF